MSHVPFKFALVAGLLVGGVSVSAQGAPSAVDKTFMTKAAVGGMAEVELGKVAQQKAASDQVKQFGSQMVDDHTKANDELKQIASAKSVTLPAALDAKHQAVMTKLQKLSGASFDRAYMAEMQKDHKEDIALFEKESHSGKDADLKGFATKTLPTLKDHMKMVHDTMSAMKTASR